MTTNHWNFDLSHSELGFKVRHMMFATVRGTFDEWSGELLFDPENLEESKVKVVVDVASINTRNDQRDDHLRSPDFFDVANHPHLTFESSSWTKTSDGYRLEGALTIRDVSHPVVLDVVENGRGIDPWGNTRAGFSIGGSINRKDFGLNWNQALEAGGVLVGDEVTFQIEVQAVQAAAEGESAAE